MYTKFCKIIMHKDKLKHAKAKQVAILLFSLILIFLFYYLASTKISKLVFNLKINSISLFELVRNHVFLVNKNSSFF